MPQQSKFKSGSSSFQEEEEEEETIVKYLSYSVELGSTRRNEG